MNIEEALDRLSSKLDDKHSVFVTEQHERHLFMPPDRLSYIVSVVSCNGECFQNIDRDLEKAVLTVEKQLETGHVI